MAFPDTPSAPRPVKSASAPLTPGSRMGHPPRRPRAAAAGSGCTCDGLALAQLLCARLCHDLIGPAAAVNAGHEMMREAGSNDREAGELAMESGQQLAGRLAFFRAAFGQGSATGGALADARGLAAGFFAGRRVTIIWPESADAVGLPADALRVLLCLLMLVAEGLPRGGEIRVDVDRKPGDVRLALVASGPVVRLAEEVSLALSAQGAAPLTARTAPAAYLGRLVRAAEGSLTLGVGDEGRLRCVATMPCIDPRLRRAAA